MNEQLINLIQKNSELNKVINSLKLQLKSLKKQTYIVENQNSNQKKQFSKEEKQILIFISKAGKATTGQIVNKLKYDLPIAEYCLKRLCENDMVFFSTVVNQQSAYYLGQEGRKYLTENKPAATARQAL